MSAETFYCQMSDGERIAVHAWKPAKTPTAIILISHGMAEYAMRYERFAEEAIKAGYAVFAADHRGHGITAGALDKLGHLADKNGFFRVMEDQFELTGEIKKRLPGLPLVLYGHSFGSFIAQLYIERHGSELAGCILTGTRGPDPAIVLSGMLVARAVTLFSNPRKPSHFLTKMSFGTCNERIPDATSPNAWISRDAEEVDKYDASPWTGFVCTSGFYRDLTWGLSAIHRKREIDKIPKDLPVYLLTGEDDPISKYGKTVRLLEKLYRSSGMKRVTSKYYPGGRHELLNDTNRAEVTSDMIGWISQVLKR